MYFVGKQMRRRLERKMTDMKIEASWPVSEKSLQDCFSILDEEKYEGFDSGTVDATRCIQCSKPEEENAEPLHITVKTIGKIISRVCIVSQSKRAELYQGSYDHIGQYLSTTTGTLLDDSDEDFVVFLKEATIESSTLDQLTMKFVGPTEESFWILSVMIITKDIQDHNHVLPCSPSLNGRFDLMTLDCMLKDQDIELSDKAKDFKRLFESFQKSKPPGLEDVHVPLSDSLKILESQMLAKIQEENAKLLLKMEEMESRQNAKLDKIIELLQQNKHDC